jgi:predicted ester cyclase
MLGRLEGRSRIGETYDNWITAFKDLAVAATDLLIDGNRAVQFVNVSGTQTGPFGTVAPTGRRIQFTAVWLYEFDGEGRIVFDRRLYDVTTVLVQLGVLKTKAGN